MNDKTKAATTGPLYLATYKYINKTGFIRAGQIAVRAKNADEAWTEAERVLSTLAIDSPKVSNVKPY